MRLVRLHQKVRRQAAETFQVLRQMDDDPPGSKTASKALTLFITRNWVNPMRSSKRGIDSVRRRNDAEGRGMG